MMGNPLNSLRSKSAVGIAGVAAGFALVASELDQFGEARRQRRKARHARHERTHDGRHQHGASTQGDKHDDNDSGEIDVLAKNKTHTPTPAPTNTPGPSATPTIVEQNAAIQNAQGQTLVGYDPVTQSWVAAGDGHIAVSGPTGARVILDTEQVIVIPPDGGNVQPTPVPGGNPEPGFNS